MVDDFNNVMTILNVLTKDKILYHQSGCTHTGPQANAPKITESKDAWARGSYQYGKREPLITIVSKCLSLPDNENYGSGTKGTLIGSLQWADEEAGNEKFTEFDQTARDDEVDKDAEQPLWEEDYDWVM